MLLATCPCDLREQMCKSHGVRKEVGPFRYNLGLWILFIPWAVCSSINDSHLLPLAPMPLPSKLMQQRSEDWVKRTSLIPTSTDTQIKKSIEERCNVTPEVLHFAVQQHLSCQASSAGLSLVPLAKIHIFSVQSFKNSQQGI